MDLLAELRKNPFVLAPMAGITDRAFRSFMREMGCSIVITELVSATGLKFNSKKTQDLMAYDEVQRPVGVQIFGEKLEDLHFAAAEVESHGADFVDLNFGCPVPKVVKKGAGSAVLKDLVVLRNVLRAVKSAVSIPVTIKVRTGWDESSKNSEQVAQVAYDEGITWMAIHGRTRSAAYTGRADWDYIKWVKEKSPIPILGNGDITNAGIARARMNESGCDGVMIGRGCLKNPWIFQEALGQDVDRDFEKIFSRLRHYLDTHFNDHISMLQQKKLAAWYSAGYPGSSQFRKNIFQIKQKSELNGAVDQFFAQVKWIPQADTSEEAFLMGGHG